MVNASAGAAFFAYRNNMAPRLMFRLPDDVQVLTELKPGNKAPNKEKAQAENNGQNIKGKHVALGAIGLSLSYG